VQEAVRPDLVVTRAVLDHLNVTAGIGERDRSLSRDGLRVVHVDLAADEPERACRSGAGERLYDALVLVEERGTAADGVALLERGLVRRQVGG
jgi:hypothetical protein